MTDHYEVDDIITSCTEIVRPDNGLTIYHFILEIGENNEYILPRDIFHSKLDEKTLSEYRSHPYTG